jgi:ABC-type multidrug transport system fused ATPase/permease subunit
LLKDAPIPVFDEPTANLDPLTEKHVLDTLFDTMKRKTSLLITHRLIGLEKINEILVMDKGRIVECGTHQELLAEFGLYHRLWDLQNQILEDHWRTSNFASPLGRRLQIACNGYSNML